MRTHKKISAGLVIAATLFPAFTFAASSVVDDKPGNYNMELISLVSLMLILLFVIGILANTLSQLGTVVRNKNRKEKQASKIAKTILMMLFFSVPVMHAFAVNVDNAKVVTPVVSTVNGIAQSDLRNHVCYWLGNPGDIRFGLLHKNVT